MILQCEEPITGKATGQLLLDYLTDTVLSHKPGLIGKPMVSPDSRHVVTLDKQASGVILVVQEILRKLLFFISTFYFSYLLEKKNINLMHSRIFQT